MQPRKNSESPRSPSILDYLSDLRVIRIIAQVAFVVVIVFSVAFLWNSIYNQLVAINATPNFERFNDRAGFAINQAPEWYSSNSTFYEAFIVGIINTLQVVWIGLVLSTVMGVLLGIFLLSPNWLIRSISRIYVEILRNTPLLVQLIFWYFVFWLGLPGNVSIPNESVMVVPLRYFVYLFGLLGTFIYIWRFNAPSRLFNGFMTGFLVAEVAFWLLGAGYPIIIVLAIIGAGVLFVSNTMDIVPKQFTGLAMGVGAMLVVLGIGHILLDLLGTVNIIEDTRFVYGEVLPLLVVGPNLFATPNFGLGLNFPIFAMAIVIGIIIAVILFTYWGNVIERTGADIPRTVYATLIVVIFGLGGWFLSRSPVSEETTIYFNPDGKVIHIVDPADGINTFLRNAYYDVVHLPERLPFLSVEAPDLEVMLLTDAIDEGLLQDNQISIYQSERSVIVQPPALNRFGTRVEVGNNISPNYMALLIGLVVYTSAFIGEIVRAGIQAVPWGQVEAARALGLSTPQTLRMIILPQALRVIIPPLGNQYLNLSKNSSLATAIAYADTYAIGQTIMNQSGQSITGFAIILAVYLTLSLIISLIMNLINSRFQLVTR